ncbi:hypothetical protein H8B15_05745 [Hymenobacter sp. BT507]|uniref:DUF1735 domain-containing protein n=1 Tax=Hymenobacter citatus TaxID=2763506 RepID=A0ABR7MHH5_9BACT|nr:hypothetical protein [Hymenobacter citatus]MBC6610413.1 hypothetical protein [Hymenobacter citatus]
MKKVLLLATLFLGLFIVGCKEIDKLLTFYIEDSQNIKIASSFPVGIAAPLSPVAVPTQSASTFKNNNTRADLVKDVSLNKLALTIADPNSENFDFLRSIEIYISTGNGSDQILLASLSNIPTGVQSITLTPTKAKLDSYIKAESYTLTTKATIAKAITRDITIRADSRFKVTADPL